MSPANTAADGNHTIPRNIVEDGGMANDFHLLAIDLQQVADHQIENIVNRDGCIRGIGHPRRQRVFPRTDGVTIDRVYHWMLSTSSLTRRRRSMNRAVMKDNA